LRDLAGLPPRRCLTAVWWQATTARAPGKYWGHENLGILYSSNDELVKIMLEIVKKGIVAYYPLIKKAQKRATELYSVGRNVNSVCNFYSEITGTKTVKFAPP